MVADAHPGPSSAYGIFLAGDCFQFIHRFIKNVNKISSRLVPDKNSSILSPLTGV
jgi:hypothetical protein